MRGTLGGHLGSLYKLWFSRKVGVHSHWITSLNSGIMVVVPYKKSGELIRFCRKWLDEEWTSLSVNRWIWERWWNFKQAVFLGYSAGVIWACFLTDDYWSNFSFSFWLLDLETCMLLRSERCPGESRNDIFLVLQNFVLERSCLNKILRFPIFLIFSQFVTWKCKSLLPAIFTFHSFIFWTNLNCKLFE